MKWMRRERGWWRVIREGYVRVRVQTDKCERENRKQGKDSYRTGGERIAIKVFSV